MKKIVILLSFILILSCIKAERMSWQFTRVTTIPGVHPVGITSVNDTLWLSDTDNNRLVQLSNDGQVYKSVNNLDRPMHIDTFNGSLYVPEYGKDAISIYADSKFVSLQINDSLDAPAGISVYNKEIAIADFYNNTIHYFNGQKWRSFGEKGRHLGQLNYPTDVQITKDFIWVADAYNNRVQVFNKQGDAIKIIGEAQKMNAATGIFVTKEVVLVTDFENNRVLEFSKNGTLLQELTTAIEKPTDIFVKHHTELYIINYRNETMTIFSKK